MKKMMVLILVILLTLAVSAVTMAEAKLSLDYFGGSTDLGAPWNANASNTGYFLNFDLPIDRFLLGLEYGALSNGHENSLSAADQTLQGIKFGYRLVDGDDFKFDAKLLYNQFEYKVKTNSTKITTKATCLELAALKCFNDRFGADLSAAFALSASTDYNGGSDKSPTYNVYGLKLFYMINENVGLSVGYKQIDNDFTSAGPVDYDLTFSGWTAGVRFQF